MKPFFAFFMVFSLLLGGNLSYGRKELVGEYWKKMINNGQSMPEAIKELLVVEDPQPQVSSSDSRTNNKDNFIRDFDIKPNVILYHSHKQKQKHKHKNPFLNNNLKEPEFQETENK